MKWIKGPFLFPSLFLLFHYKLWLGIQTLAADTGDGLGAFKFFSLPLRYWNWYESGGQPYWAEYAVYRLQDPLMWPLLFFVKALPVSVIQQFNLYILLRLAFLGVGAYYLVKAWGGKLLSRHCASALMLFGSAFPVMFRSVGAIDLITCFLGVSLFGTLLLQTQKRGFLWLVFLVLLHSVTTYHFLYLIPIVLLVIGLNLRVAKEAFGTLRNFKRDTLFASAAVLLAISAEYIAVKDPFLLPMLRSIRYNTWVDGTGKVIEKEIGLGESVLEEKKLEASVSECGTRFSCRAYDLTLLKTFLTGQSAWSLTGYVSLLGLLFLILSLSLLKDPFIRTLWSVAVLSFLLSLGGQTPLWGGVQSLIFPLKYVRHTGFYFHFFVFLLCLLIALTANHFLEKYSSKVKVTVFLVMFLDLLVFNKLHVGEFLNFTKEGQIEKTNTSPSKNFSNRTLRIYNPYLIPRSSASTTYGEPTVLESVFVQDEITPEHLRKGENPRHFGFITLFQSKPMSEERIRSGGELERFKERVGVHPYGVLTPVMERKESIPLEMHGESLKASLQLEKDQTLYLAVPMEAIGVIRLDNREISFASREAGYGVLLSVSKGKHELEIVPYLGRRNLIYFLYYGGYFLWLVGLVQPEKFFSRIFRETSFNLSDLLSRTMASRSERT